MFTNNPNNPFEARPEIEPPSSLKIFAPDGTTQEIIGWVGMGPHPMSPQLVQLFYLEPDKKGSVILNPKVVVQNMSNGKVVYDPRVMLKHNDRHAPALLRHSEIKWLQDHPHWPAILELYDNPVEEGNGNNEGITR